MANYHGSLEAVDRHDIASPGIQVPDAVAWAKIGDKDCEYRVTANGTDSPSDA